MAEGRRTISCAPPTARSGATPTRARSSSRRRRARSSRCAIRRSKTAPRAGARAAGRPAQPDRRARDRQSQLRRRGRAGAAAEARQRIERKRHHAGRRDPRRRPDRLLPARRRRGDAAVRQSRGLRPRGVPADRRAAVPGVPHRHDRPARHRLVRPAAAALWPHPARPGRARRDRAGRPRRRHRRRHLARQQSPGPARRPAPGAGAPAGPDRRADRRRGQRQPGATRRLPEHHRGLPRPRRLRGPDALPHRPGLLRARRRGSGGEPPANAGSACRARPC